MTGLGLHITKVALLSSLGLQEPPSPFPCWPGLAQTPSICRHPALGRKDWFFLVRGGFLLPRAAPSECCSRHGAGQVTRAPGLATLGVEAWYGHRCIEAKFLLLASSVASLEVWTSAPSLGRPRPLAESESESELGAAPLMDGLGLC